MNAVRPTSNQETKMRIGKKKAGLAIFAAAVSLIAVIAFSPPGQNRIMCLLLPQTETQFRTITVEVPEQRHGELLEFLRGFSSNHGLLFAIDEYPTGAAGIAHRRYQAQACNRFIDITIANTFDKNSFSIYISYFGDHPSTQFMVIESSLARGLQRFN